MVCKFFRRPVAAYDKVCIMQAAEGDRVCGVRAVGEDNRFQ